MNKICPHFGVCGGCASQDRAYADQLAEKEAVVRRVMAPFSPGEFRPIRPSPDVFHYRNKMEFAFGGAREGSVRLGLREKDRFDRLVDLRECFLMSPETPVLLEAVRRWARDAGLAPYDLKSHRGFLRYLVLREGKNTGQRLVHLVTARGELPRESFLAALESSGAPADAVVWSVHEGVSDVARGETSLCLKGDGFIRETLQGLPFRISAAAFFQTNTRGAEILYKMILDSLGDGAEALVDLYCGSGAIGLFCASRARRLVGVEIHAPSVEDARANAREQNRDNASFFCLDAAAFAGRADLMSVWTASGAAAILDPPRAGLQPAVRRLLREKPVERWVYVSCNPDALARDLPLLADMYAVEIVQPVDLFPHTPHVETVLLLRKKTRGC